MCFSVAFRSSGLESFIFMFHLLFHKNTSSGLIKNNNLNILPLKTFISVFLIDQMQNRFSFKKKKGGQNKTFSHCFHNKQVYVL